MENRTSLQIKKMSPVLLVKDLDLSLRYYSEVLGFDVEFVYGDFYAGILQNGNSIHLKTGSPLPEVLASRSKNEDIHLVFSVENIGDLYEAYLNKGVTVMQPLREMDYGREFYITDPDGYTLAFLEN